MALSGMSNNLRMQAISATLGRLPVFSKRR